MSKFKDKVNIDRDVCRKIAEAIVERWTKDTDDYRNIMHMVFEKNGDAGDVANSLTEELYDSIRNVRKDHGFLDIFLWVETEISKILEKMYEEFKSSSPLRFAQWRHEAAREEKYACI